jgi:hypothetical protein
MHGIMGRRMVAARMHCCVLLQCNIINKRYPVTDPKAQRGVARRGWVVSTTPQLLYTREKPGTHCTGGWVGPRAGLDMCKKNNINTYCNSCNNSE